MTPNTNTLSVSFVDRTGDRSCPEGGVGVRVTNVCIPGVPSLRGFPEHLVET